MNTNEQRLELLARINDLHKTIDLLNRDIDDCKNLGDFATRCMRWELISDRWQKREKLDLARRNLWALDN